MHAAMAMDLSHVRSSDRVKAANTIGGMFLSNPIALTGSVMDIDHGSTIMDIVHESTIRSTDHGNIIGSTAHGNTMGSTAHSSIIVITAHVTVIRTAVTAVIMVIVMAIVIGIDLRRGPRGSVLVASGADGELREKSDTC